MITAIPHQTIIMDDIHILPFDGWHSSPDHPASFGYPATGYRVQVGTQHWLFLNDLWHRRHLQQLLDAWKNAGVKIPICVPHRYEEISL